MSFPPAVIHLPPSWFPYLDLVFLVFIFSKWRAPVILSAMHYHPLNFLSWMLFCIVCIAQILTARMQAQVVKAYISLL